MRIFREARNSLELKKKKILGEIIILMFDAVVIVIMNFKTTSFECYFCSGCVFETVLIDK